MFESLNISASNIWPLTKALRKVLQDGYDALSTNMSAPQGVAQKLKACESCSVGRVTNDVSVIDGDGWAESVDGYETAKKIDIVLAASDDNQPLTLFPVEGKLGITFRYPGDKAGSSLTLAQLVEKYQGLKSLVGGCARLLPKLLVLVPKDGQEFTWYRVRGWNLAGNGIGKVLSCCLCDFLRLFGFADVERVVDCQGDAFRFRLLKSEVDSVGPMSQVQLPGAGDCIGCRKCREACPVTAIAVVPDDRHEGMMHPYVDTRSCRVGCRHCESACPVLHPSR